MAKELTRNVYVDGVLYGPDGEKPSADVAKEITNPKAWGEDEEKAEKPSAKPSTAKS